MKFPAMPSKGLQDGALELARKFGFLSKDVFWEFFCPPGKSARYAHWSTMCSSPLFASYSFRGGIPQHLFLSAKGRQTLGKDTVSTTSMTYLIHDELVVRFYLLLKRLEFLNQVWSESELKADRLLALKGLGGGIAGKLPDLLFDVAGDSGNVRCALEVERTRKSQRRYKTMKQAYSRATNIDLIIFGVADKKIESAILDEIFTSAGSSIGKEIGFFDLPEFCLHGLESKLRIAGKETTLGKFFSNLASRVQRGAENSRKDSA